MTSLDLSNFDTSNVTSMAGLFTDSLATEINTSNSDMSSATNINPMFRNTHVSVIDLSNVDTSSVTSYSSLFQDTTATICYVKTQVDADKLSASTNLPATLSFVVK